MQGAESVNKVFVTIGRKFIRPPESGGGKRMRSVYSDMCMSDSAAIAKDSFYEYLQWSDYML